MSTAVPKVAPLVTGQRLSREEFLRRYEAMPHVKKAELIGGVVYLGSPVSRGHGIGDNSLATWLGLYAAFTPGCEAADNSTWLMLADAPQPDSDLRILPECGGTSGLDGQYGSGTPELVAEVSHSSKTRDLGVKKELYRAAGVREYLVLLVAKRELRWHRLVDGNFQVLAVPADGILRSVVFPGLWLDVPALLSGDMARVVTLLQQGLQSPEHAAFVAELQQRRSQCP